MRWHVEPESLLLNAQSQAKNWTYTSSTPNLGQCRLLPSLPSLSSFITLGSSLSLPEQTTFD